jgi:hypothetical protein
MGRAIFVIFGIGVAFGLNVAPWAGTAAGERISKPVVPPTPQRQVATEWVRDVDKGNQRAACELQTTAEVGGRPCGALPERVILHCPRATGGSKPSRPRSIELRMPAQQLGAVTEESADQAFVALYAERLTSKARGAVGLELVGGSWRISYIRQGNQIYAPAGLVWQTKTWRTLWVAPSCAR